MAKRLSSAAVRRFQAKLVAQLRAYNAQLGIQASSVSAASAEGSRSVSVDFEFWDRQSEDSVNQQAATTSKNCISPVTLCRIQNQLVAHLRAYNRKLRLQAEVEPCRLGAVATTKLRSGKAPDSEDFRNNNRLVSVSFNGAEYCRKSSKICCRGLKGACFSAKRRIGSLYSGGVKPMSQDRTIDFARLKKRMRSSSVGEERAETNESEMASAASDENSYVLDRRLTRHR